MFSKASNDNQGVSAATKFKLFMVGHWRGVLSVLVPILLLPMVLGEAKHYHFTAYTLLLMAIFWVSECIPLAVTSFIPIVLFPLFGVMDTGTVCDCYCSDTVMMFLGSIILAYSVEQSGLHKRLAYSAIQLIGYSHYKLLLAMCIVTTFASMWITNTAATTMMVPINHALLKVFEDEKVLKKYETLEDGTEVASTFTVCYFCAATFSATIGGIGTLVGTGTNLVFKGFFQIDYPDAPEYLSFPKFSAFGVPYMIVLEVFLYLCLVITFFGFLRPNSDAAKRSNITPAAKAAAKQTIQSNMKALGPLTFWEAVVIILFSGAMVSFFCRSPQIFPGWADKINDYYGLGPGAFIRDSALAMFVSFIMFVTPSHLGFFKNFTAKFYEDLPKKPITSVLNWKILNASMPYSFMFLLGGGFSLSTASKVSGLNDVLGEQMQGLKSLPNIVVLLCVVITVTLVTNLASNIAVCNVFTPISMQLAKEINQNPLWYTLASGFAASYAFMVPVGTPGNLIVQGSAKITSGQMIRAGFLPTITTIIITWVFMILWAPVIWPDLRTVELDWLKVGPPAPE